MLYWVYQEKEVQQYQDNEKDSIYFPWCRLACGIFGAQCGCRHHPYRGKG